MKITFEMVDGLRQFQKLSTGDCFTYPEPTTDQVYMKMLEPAYGCVSLKTGQFYSMKHDKMVRPVDCEVIVRPL